ncbi:MAG: ATP-binding protein, partial [Chitinophagaceae bacterium]|nr:ATP-binding protein [Chitinophagaceae bacterium]
VVRNLLEQGQRYYFSQPDSSLFYSLQALDLARVNNHLALQARALNSTGESYRFLGDYPKSIRSQFAALDIYRQLQDAQNQALTSIFIGFSLLEMGDYRHALDYLLPARRVMEDNGDRRYDCFSSSHIGYAYLMLGEPDSAMLYSQRAYDSLKTDYVAALRSLVISRLGRLYEVKGQTNEALRFYHESLSITKRANVQVHVIRVSNFLAGLHARLGNTDSALYYARETIAGSQGDGQRPQVLSAASLLADLFHKKGRIDSAYYYQSMVLALKDSLYGADQFRDLQVLTLDEQRKQQELVEAQKAQRNRYLFVILGIIAAALAMVAWIQYRNSRHKSETNRILSAQKTQIEKTLQELKLAQAQLIQSEKMASLGEMTAGIAHEIQNPLNFVNNFSDLNTELIDELRASIKTGEKELALHLTRDIQSNQDKISAHGKRADAIVKSMLQHSRSSTGQRELTDINKLAEEYLKLAFHGMRVKDKSFNVTLQTSYDPAVGEVSVNAQDIGRAMLNLLNNAFYAVQKRKQETGNGFEGLVRIRTNRLKKKVQSGDTSTDREFVEIKLEDNGPGIPQKNLDKIFQPFFTTKPAGEGTGLGLSLSYDIVRSHGGEIKVSSREGEGTEFSILLPA